MVPASHAVRHAGYGLDMSAFPVVRVRGTAYERGRQYGEQARTRVHASIEAYRRVFEHYAGWDWPAVQREAARFEAPVADFRPWIVEEMRGIADGAGAGFVDVLAINVRTEVMFAAKARQAAALSGAPGAGAQVPGECSAFAVLPAAGLDGAGSVLIGQNWDWLVHARDTVVVLSSEPDDGPSFVTVVEAGLLAKAGMNSAGLGLVTNALVTDDDQGSPGLPYHVLLRALLSCCTVTEAVRVLQEGVRSSSANYLIAHASGSVLDIEAAPGGFTRLYPLYPSDGVLLHTNHFRSPALHATDLGPWAMPDTLVRLQRLQARISGELKTGDLRLALADHADHPNGICAHEDADAHPCDQGATIASMVIDLTAGQMWLASGQPCKVPFEQHAGLPERVASRDPRTLSGAPAGSTAHSARSSGLDCAVGTLDRQRRKAVCALWSCGYVAMPCPAVSRPTCTRTAEPGLTIRWPAQI
jgi:isopenicillin-N N-acyltransferase-like protein